MSHDTSWNIEDHQDEHESEEHWALRRAFLERWKQKYPMDRLLCLARVFANIESMGCRYPQQVMLEISALSEEVARTYRSSKKNMLQRTFVSASDAAEDRAKGVKRKAGLVEDSTPKRINFVAQGQTVEIETVEINDDTPKVIEINSDHEPAVEEKTEERERSEVEIFAKYDYVEEFSLLPCLDVRRFRENMFNTSFGRFVLMARTWMQRLNNITASCAACGLPVENTFSNGCMTLKIKGQLVASATGSSKAEARSIIEAVLWKRIVSECVILLVKEPYMARDCARINGDNVGGVPARSTDNGLATPVESSVAAKMMKLMGWSGGGLGANEEGISEPIKPHLQQVHRAGLGSNSELRSMHELKRKVANVMRQYKDDDTLDYDLVFSADFSKEERSELHQVARRCGLNSKSYGTGEDRFLVVRKKLEPFSLTRAVVQSGGDTPKYRVILPRGLDGRL